MKIAIDATIIREEITGTGFYITNLLNGLAKIDDLNKYYIFGDKQCLEEFIKINKKNFIIVNKRFKNRVIRVLWQYFIFPFILKKKKIDILHSPNYITPLFKLGFKIILTVHDLTFLLFPQKYTITKRLLFGKMLPFFIKMSDKIVTVSSNTKKDILKFFNIPEDKIVVTYESYPDYYNHSIDRRKAKDIVKKYGIERDYILYVGMIEPRKNIIFLLKAFVELDKDLELDLVIVGKKGWYFKEIEKYMENTVNLRLENKIIFTGYIPEYELKYFYRLALMFVYPTLYEGFGLPPLQAMACGTPVITSNISSLPEVVGDAAILINPNNIKELIEAIRLLYNNSVKREELIERGLDQIKKFSLTNIAKRNLETYKSLV
jgi:glycosyltransferase involved in cell wall biosynthesis